jgi:FkbM family methyltransferase
VLDNVDADISWGNRLRGIVNKILKISRALQHKNTAKALLYHRVAGAMEHKNALRNLRCLTVVDVGANRGQFALAARECYPEARIISFEPLPEPAAQFQKIFEEDKNVVLHQAAIGQESGNATIHISQRDDSSSLLPITSTQNELFPGTLEKSTDEIKIGRLSEFLAVEDITSPSLLKLDVQGFELEALRGSADILHKFNYIYAECSFVELYKGQALADDIIQYLKKHEFNMVGVYNLTYDHDGKAIQGDFLFSKD